MKTDSPSPNYIEQAMLLSKDDAERLLSRMRRKLTSRLEREKIDPLHAVAFQLQFEDEQLKERRENLAELRKRYKG
ncbi:MAG: hypothetical protein Q7T44_17925 [Parvibaculum sp.]|nr:hypothetical protein [Parvibaculum sp.]